MEKDDTTECWYRVATLMKQANELLFTSHHHTNEIIRTGEYLNILQTFQPLLHDFAVKFDQTRCKPSCSSHEGKELIPVSDETSTIYPQH